MAFPVTRPRRLRATPALRALVAETQVSCDDLIYPLFVDARARQPAEIAAMPGQYRWPVERLGDEARRVRDVGLRSVLLFGLPDWKDATGSSSWHDEGVVQRAIGAIKRAAPELVVITDVCLCEYTDHGHCGVLDGERVDNDTTLDLLARQALSHARAGADIVAPSDMMDGRVGALRAVLDREGYADTPILSYAAKYSSAFYGPFREAAECAPQFGDRSAYQQDPARSVGEALREVALDLDEGADAVMVKPALSYLDVVRAVRDAVDVPVAAYQVSGEYAMVEAAAAQGWVDRERIILETLTSVKRAGADMILTYWASEVASLLR